MSSPMEKVKTEEKKDENRTLGSQKKKSEGDREEQ